MIRKYIPKGTNFDHEPIEKIKYIQEEINNYPRKIFDYNTSNDMFIKELNALKIPKNTYSFLFHKLNLTAQPLDSYKNFILF